MRISGGEARGTRLKVPAGARPAAERVRQAVFGSLGVRVTGARVLDLYCGSGAYGLEALSRGAVEAILVDRDGRALAAARHNAEAARLSDRATFVRRDAVTYLRSGAARREPFDLVFCDPPYAEGDALGRILLALGRALTPDAIVVAESRTSAVDAPTAEGFTLEADRRYGDTRVLIYRWTGDGGVQPRPGRRGITHPEGDRDT